MLPTIKKIQTAVTIAFVSAFFADQSVYAQTPESEALSINVPTLMSFYDRSRDLPGVSETAPDPPFRTIRTIVLDPGHGGENDGAVGVAHQFEKRLTLQLAFDLRDALRRTHPEVKVLLTRYEDRTMKLSERVAFANAKNADLFFSLHYNAATHNRALGYEAFVLSPDAQRTNCKNPVRSISCKAQREGSQQLGEAVIEAFETNHPEMINRGLKEANFGVLRGARMPAVVVEAGFLTHPKEGREVVTEKHRRLTVKALMQAIETFDKTNTIYSTAATPKSLEIAAR